MKQLLFVTPHYPPDGAAGAHRARVLAPYLGQHGWQPTVLTLDRCAYEGTLDEELESMAHGDVEVVRAPALSARWTRSLGVGDLGLRALRGLRTAAHHELARRRFDVIYVTTYPIYPALMAPGLKRRFDVPFVLDLQDPWVGAWGATVGPGVGGGPDLKSRASRAAALAIEKRVLPHADALTSVSSHLLETLRTTYPTLALRPSLELPIGIDPCDFAWAACHPRPNPFFDVSDQRFHVCYVGTLLPLATDVLRAVLMAVKRLRDADAEVAARLQLHFIGTSNQAVADAADRVMPLARELGVDALVTEHAPRVPFADALRTHLAASALLLMGSTEARYTASKAAPALASGQPLLVVAHARSDALRQLQESRDPGIRIASFASASDLERCSADVESILREWLKEAPARGGLRADAVRAFTGPVLAERFARLLDSVTLQP